MDIAYAPIACGFVYLTAVVGWFSRRVLAWRASISLEAEFCLEAVSEALARFGKPDIFNADQRRQFTCAPFRSLQLDGKIAISMDSRGAWRQRFR